MKTMKLILTLCIPFALFGCNADGGNSDGGADDGGGDSQSGAADNPSATPSGSPTFVQQAYLKASNGEKNDEFGNSVALDGDTLVVGAFQEDGDLHSTAASPNDNATDSGAVYVYTLSGGAWSQQAYLKASNASEDVQFGYSVAIDGDTLVVGANRESGDAFSTAENPNFNADGSGAVYVFTRTSGQWKQQAYLKAFNAYFDDRFGESVDLDDNTLVVGAPLELGDASSTLASPNRNADKAGAVYVFTRSSGAWSLQAYLKASNAYDNQGFGDEVALDGDTLAVGANEEVFVYTGSGALWNQQAHLKASHATSDILFGQSVALDGDTLVVGAPRENGDANSTDATPNEDATNAGAAYVFARNGLIWSQQAYLKASNAENYDHFGVDVTINGDTLVVGAPLEDGDANSTAAMPNNDNTWAGAAYVFTRSGGVWTQQDYLKASNAWIAAYFGSSVSLSGDTMVLGASGETGDASSTTANPNNSAPLSGAAYVFQ